MQSVDETGRASRNLPQHESVAASLKSDGTGRDHRSRLQAGAPITNRSGVKMWVLILDTPYNQKPPLAIGGYDTREEAEKAGSLALSFDNVETSMGYFGSRMPHFTSYVVIPGAACMEAAGATSCELVRDDDGKIRAVVRRFEGGAS